MRNPEAAQLRKSAIERFRASGEELPEFSPKGCIHGSVCPGVTTSMGTFNAFGQGAQRSTDSY
jgi:hypothetical protein